MSAEPGGHRPPLQNYPEGLESFSPALNRPAASQQSADGSNYTGFGRKKTQPNGVAAEEFGTDWWPCATNPSANEVNKDRLGIILEQIKTKTVPQW